jgi:hypothetical protein
MAFKRTTLRKFMNELLDGEVCEWVLWFLLVLVMAHVVF